MQWKERNGVGGRGEGRKGIGADFSKRLPLAVGELRARAKYANDVGVDVFLLLCNFFKCW